MNAEYSMEIVYPESGCTEQEGSYDLDRELDPV